MHRNSETKLSVSDVSSSAQDMADIQKITDNLLLIQVQFRFCVTCSQTFPIDLTYGSRHYRLTHREDSENTMKVTLHHESDDVEDVKLLQFASVPLAMRSPVNSQWTALLNNQWEYCPNCRAVATKNPNYLIFIHLKVENPLPVSDVEFNVRGVKMAASLEVIARGSVFLAEKIQQNRLMNSTEAGGTVFSVAIDDTRPEVFQQLLTFLYTRKVPALEEEGMAVSLFIASDKYGVNALKDECIAYLAAQLNYRTPKPIPKKFLR